MSGITKGKVLYSDAVTSAESFFDEIITILITSISFIVSVQLIKTKSSPVLTYTRKEYLKADFPIAAIGEKKVYSFKIFEILEKIADQQKIDFIEYVAYEKTLENISNVTNATVFENQDTYYFIRKVIAGCYLTYYEKIKDTIHQLYGTDPLHWPSELQFARVVRNAFAHHTIV